MMSKKLPQSLAAFLAGMMLAAAPLHAQTGGATQGNAGQENNAATSGASSGTSTAGASSVGESDMELIQDIAHANLAEIEIGKMALDKSQNERVRKFAQTLVDDHTAAMKELTTLAQSKGVSLPQETDVQHKAISTALGALSGNAFDEQFIARVGVGDHQRTHDLLQKAQKEAKMPELKSYARKTQKVVDQHLATAKKLEKRQ